MNAASTETIADTVMKIAQDILGVSEVPTGSIREALDSMNRLALMVEIEDHFLIAFEPEEEDAIENFEDLVQCISMKLQTT